MESFLWLLGQGYPILNKPQYNALQLEIEYTQPLVVASAAMHGAVLTVLAFARVGPWKDSFPCFTMKKPSFYDWLR